MSKKEKVEAFEFNPRVAEIDKELEKLDAKRLADLKKIKAEGAKLVKEKAHLQMIDQLTLRILNDLPLSDREVRWVEENPKEWKKIKEATAGKRGSRIVQRAVANGKPG
jgi:hypothetical protein